MALAAALAVAAVEDPQPDSPQPLRHHHHRHRHRHAHRKDCASLEREADEALRKWSAAEASHELLQNEASDATTLASRKLKEVSLLDGSPLQQPRVAREHVRLAVVSRKAADTARDALAAKQRAEALAARASAVAKAACAARPPPPPEPSRLGLRVVENPWQWNGGKATKDRDDVKPPAVQPTHSLAAGYYAIKGGRANKYCKDNGDYSIVCNRPAIGPSELFYLTPVDAHPGRYTLRGGLRNQWCTEDVYGARVVCNRPEVGASEHFQLEPLGDDRYAFRGGRSGKWCTDDWQLTCDADTVSEAEAFTVSGAMPRTHGEPRAPSAQLCPWCATGGARAGPRPSSPHTSVRAPSRRVAAARCAPAGPAAAV